MVDSASGSNSVHFSQPLTNADSISGAAPKEKSKFSAGSLLKGLVSIPKNIAAATIGLGAGVVGGVKGGLEGLKGGPSEPAGPKTNNWLTCTFGTNSAIGGFGAGAEAGFKKTDQFLKELPGAIINAAIRAKGN
ncbi:MAG: hypothetical protein Q8K75_08315 [Chlamydiales bacterium]|nr:hypothetical protein [Chlamydiales bacterium]